MRALPFLFLALLPFALGAAAQESFVMIHAVDQEGRYEFLPAEATIVPGGTISVMAFGVETHSMRAVDGSFDTGPLDPAHPEGYQVELRAPDVPGEYPFFCPYHASASTPVGSGMTGLLIVQQAAAAPSPSPSPAASPASTPGLAVGALLAALGVAALAWRARA